MLYLIGEIIIFLLLAMVLGILLGGYLRGLGGRFWRRELTGIRKRTHALEEGRQAMMEAGESLRARLEMLEAHAVQFSQRMGDAESDLSALGEFKNLFQILNQAHAREISRVDALEARFRWVEGQLTQVGNIGPGLDDRSVHVEAFGVHPATPPALPSGEPTPDLAACLQALDASFTELVARVDALSAQLETAGEVSVDDVFDEGTNVEGPSVGALVARLDVLSAQLEAVEGARTGEGECDGGPSVADLAARLDALSAQIGIEHPEELEGILERLNRGQEALSERIEALDGCAACEEGGVQGGPTLASAGAERDNLKRIRGIGRVVERILNEAGVHRFAQIAEWSEEDVTFYSEFLGEFSTRIRRDGWIEQARELAEGNATRAG